MTSRNRAAVRAAGVLIGCLAGVAAARADHQPVIVMPGNWQVPVVIDGVPATGALVTGDWGLYAPGRVTPEVLGPVLVPVEPRPGYYYPHTGRRPRYGRQEVLGPRRLGPPAPTFYRSWSAKSGDGPVTQYPSYPSYDPPPVTLAPRDRYEAPIRPSPRRGGRSNRGTVPQ